ncbi:unnamed protein product [Bemisia tabaci]|uniref:Ionotropic receptor n=1 Tax=Bemisia tabaci TaxID=7038 RepID=A0A9P0F7E6_BEMTA|nr:unnamed protein product [Bemisia tabaci]
MLFILDDFSNILNLILSSQNFGKVGIPATSLQNPKKVLRSLDGKLEAFNLPKFCVHLEAEFKPIIMDPRRPCDENITISDIQLQGDSHLSEALFNQIRGLSQNNVWNSRNYLIFYVVSTFQVPQILEENSRRAGDPIHSLSFAFRFIWRLFKGQKTLICLREACYRYDPFFEKIHEYVGGGGEEEFFDFSWFSMNRKPFTYSVVFLTPFDFDATVSDICAATTISPLLDVAWYFEDTRDGNVKGIPKADFNFNKDALYSFDSSTHRKHLEFGLKYGVDLLAIGAGLGNLANLRDYDISPALESCKLTFRLPRKGFMPQEVVPFYCFSLALWIFVIVTLLILALIHHALVIANINIFSRSNVEESHELFPTLMTIFRYALGIVQPRLIMVELMVGKIFFLIVVFSMMILITLFQSGMFSLLSSRVRYSDIDTFKEIEESDLVVQSSGIDIDAQFLGDGSEFDWIRQKLTDGFKFRCDRHWVYVHSIDDDIDLNETFIGFDEENLVRREVDAMLESNAFLIRMTTKYTELQDLMYMDLSTKKEYEFHIPRERLLSYPLMYFMPRNGFYHEVVNDVLLHMVEMGLFNDGIGTSLALDFSRYQAREDKIKARPFNLTDLRLAFVSLVIGWVLSGFCFIIELL